MFEHYRKVHFVGIGGVGMSGIAEVLHNLGYEITGSDIKNSATVKRLKSMGIKVLIGHRPDNIGDAHVVVISSAVSEDNPEVIEARRRSIPVIPRAEMLAEIGRLKYSILVAGAHGKTTTTSLISTVLTEAGLDPTVVIGGKLKATGTGASLGKGEFLVAEADESDGSFLKLSPTIAVATNIDREHMNYFKTMDNLCAAFRQFLDKVPFYGISIICYEDIYLRNIMNELNRRYISYGFSEDAMIRAKDIKSSGINTSFKVEYRNENLGKFTLPMIGKYNVLNALASIAVARELRVDTEVVRKALSGFRGIQRRFELKASVSGIRVYDDYGHHPTEIRNTLRAIKEAFPGRLIVIFQPHRYSRTYDLFNDFCTAFSDADILFLLDIYPAGERPIDGVSSALLADAIKTKGKEVHYFPDRSSEKSDISGLVEDLIKTLKKGDVVLTLGAGDVYKISDALAERLKR
jgi:UDP-N-acetylmuramate--alanine ligase